MTLANSDSSTNTLSLRRRRFVTLRALAAEGKTREQEVREQVTAARAAGCSWSMIGDALGVSKQGAAQRYGPRPSGRAAAPPTTVLNEQRPPA